MAFYGFNGDAGECYSTPYTSNYDYDYVPSQASSPYFYHHEFNDSKLIDHDPLYNYHDMYATMSPDVNYSTYGFDQPKFLQYEPTPYVTGYISSEIKYTVSYSTQEFVNVLAFEEYDPTPYDGGYDATQVYGKPLPPSAEICYPLSEKVADGYSLKGFSFASIPSPYGKDDDHSVKPQADDKLSNSTKDDREPSHGKEDHDSDHGSSVENGGIVCQGEEDHDSDHDSYVENGGIGEYDYERRRQVPNISYGSGLEAMDICECVFGYWPCLDKMNRESIGNQETLQRESNSEPWKSAADYLFRWPLGYGERKDGGYGDYDYSHGSYAKHGY